MKMDEPQKIEPYVIFPRYIPSDFKSGKLTPNEWKLYSWLRQNMNPYGITTTGVSSIQDDIFNGVSKNYIEKLLLSLRRKRYLHFDNRQGRRGSFEVRFGDLITPNGVIVSIAHYFDDREVISEDTSKFGGGEQVGNNTDVESHKSKEQKEAEVNRFSATPETPQVISPYNEYNTENINTTSPFKGIPVVDFHPQTNGESVCKRIALELKEEYINSLLKILRTDGFSRLEEAMEIYREHKAQGKKIEKSGAYFHGIIKSLRGKI